MADDIRAPDVTTMHRSADRPSRIRRYALPVLACGVFIVVARMLLAHHRNEPRPPGAR